MDKRTIRFIIVGLSGMLFIVVFNFVYVGLLLDLSRENFFLLAKLNSLFLAGSTMLGVPVALYLAKPILKFVAAKENEEPIDEQMLMKAQNAALRFPTILAAFILSVFVVAVFIIAALLLYRYDFPKYEVIYITISSQLTGVLGVLILHFVFKVMERGRIDAVMELRSNRELNRHTFRLPIFTKLLVSVVIIVIYFLTLSIMMGYNLSLKALQSQLEEENTYWVETAARRVRSGNFDARRVFENLTTGQHSKLLILNEEGEVFYQAGNGTEGVSDAIAGKFKEGSIEGTEYIEDLDITYSFKTIPDKGIIIGAFSSVKVARGHAGGVRNTILLMFGGSLLLCLLISPFLANDINYPLKKIIEYVNDITREKPREAIDVLSEDEFSDLIFSVLEMKRSLDTQKRHVEELLYNVSETIKRQGNTATRLWEVSKEQIGGAAEQNLAVQEAITTSEEIVATASQIAENAANVHEVASKTLESCKTGTERNEVTLKSLVKLKNEVLTIAHKMGMLQAAGRSISKITQLIKAISDKTQLLSLNASLEASGAGETGKRFEVVASEVRRLAEHSTEAAERISHITGLIDEDISSTLETMEACVITVGKAERLISDIKKALEKISTHASEATLASQEISYSTRQQTASSEQMSRTINRVSDVARNTEENAGQLNNTADGIRDLTLHLKTLVEEKPNG